MQRRPVRTLLAALLAAGTLLPAAALTTAPPPHGALPSPLTPPATVSVTTWSTAPTSFAAGAVTATRPNATPTPAQPPQETVLPLSLHDVLPDAGTAPALLLGLMAVAGALMRMVQHGNR